MDKKSADSVRSTDSKCTLTSSGFEPIDSLFRIKTYSEVKGTKDDIGMPTNDDIDVDTPSYTDLY